MSKLQTTNLSRRDFFKAAAGATIAVAAAGSVLPNVGAGKAFAAQSASGRADVVETRTVTGNVYVDKADTPIKKNAYLTNDGNPPFNMPTSPVEGNVTLEVTADGKKLLTVPIVNDTFGALSISDVSTDGSVSVVDVAMGDWTAPNSWSTPYEQRITSITFDVTNFAGGAAIATFSPCKEYATFPLYKGDKDWDLHLIAEL